MVIQFERRLRTLPVEEVELLRNAIESAEVQAGFGQCGEGYSELAYGLHRAEMMLRDGIPWASELQTQYRSALDEYCSRFRLATA